MFQITGKIDGQVYKLKYRQNDDNEDYIVSGDDVAVEKLFAESKIDHGMLGPIPADHSFKEGYLTGELATEWLATLYVFDEVIEETNDWEPFDADVIY
ncbi:hypothetical protein FACS1894172_20890 [Spirochaetia bacterium]|nr:hypothetical protein FACS1894164_18760 [Spirochaetia bacterium]GHU37476.1 hypothetical protein FACS1894172_20890 [Spirochaetia bacterium]